MVRIRLADGPADGCSGRSATGQTPGKHGLPFCRAGLRIFRAGRKSQMHRTQSIVHLTATVNKESNCATQSQRILCSRVGSRSKNSICDKPRGPPVFPDGLPPSQQGRRSSALFVRTSDGPPFSRTVCRPVSGDGLPTIFFERSAAPPALTVC